MKKTQILTLGLGLWALTMAAQQAPGVYPDRPFNRVSPAGTMAITEEGGILNLETGDYVSYKNQYVPGSGNCISNDNTVVGYQMSTERASIWHDGSWEYMPGAESVLMSYANGITPDGSRVVGNMVTPGYGGDFEGHMLQPGYWERNSDGSYGEFNPLPHPQVDFTGRSPQYVTAVVVAEDGKTIAGQMRDFSGFVCQPVIYTQADNGEWSYTLLVDELFHPAGVSLPEDPGDGPQPQDFMTQEEIQKFNLALDMWEAAGSDYYNYPNIYDFMNPEEIIEFEEALNIWNEESTDFYIAVTEFVNMVPNFSFNNVFMDPQAKWYVSTDTKGFYDEFTGQTDKNYTIYKIDLSSGNYVTYPAVDDIHIIASDMAQDGTILAQYKDENYNIFNGYILPAGESEFVSLYDYLAKDNESLAEWMQEHMTHTYEAINPEDWTTYDATTLATGVPHCSLDFSVIVTAVANFWNYDSVYNTYGYVIYTSMEAGVESLISPASQVSLRSLPGGALELKGDVKALKVYNLSGSQVFSTSCPTGVVATGLKPGIYLVQVSDNAGAQKTEKIIIK